MNTFAYGIILGVIIIFIILKFFFPSYLKEKGKNLATKEDIENITNRIESVKTDYAKVLEEVRTNNQLMLSEIDRQNKKRSFYECSRCNNKKFKLYISFITFEY